MTPPHQLSLNLQPRERETPPTRSFGQRVRGEWPLWLAFACFAQATFMGLVPAISESRRLAGEETEMYARYQRDMERHEELWLLLRAQDDPIYREREKKLLAAPENPLAAR